MVCPINPTSIWKFDGDATDSSGSNDGTLFGAPSFVSGLISPGQAISFDGVNDYIEIPQDASLELSTFTWYGWIDFTNMVSTPNAQVPIYGNTDTGPAGWVIFYDDQSPGVDKAIAFQLRRSGGSNHKIQSVNNSVTTGIHFVLVTYNNSDGDAHIYIDNVDETDAFSPILNHLNSFTHNFRFNAWPDGVGGSYGFFHGVVYSNDQSAIYPYVFNATERSDVYGGGSGLDCPPAPSATLAGSTVPDATEAEIVSGGQTTIITITDDTFKAAGTGPIGSIADTQALIDGFTSAQSEVTGWNNEVRDKEVVGSVTRDSDTQATITWSAQAAYDITSNETITGTIPIDVLVIGAAPIVATPTFQIIASNSTASITGTLSDGGTEAEIKAGTETIVITITDDTFVATVGDDNSITQDLIDGIDSAQAEAAGWDAIVKAGLTFSDVTRDSDTQVTVFLPAFPSYEITSNETIEVTVPASALTGASPLVATPTFDITTSVTSAALTDSLSDGATEAQIKAGTETLVITITNDTWGATVGDDNAITQAIIDGLDSDGVEANGWDAIVKAGLTFSDVTRDSDTQVTILLPAFGSYEILATETITATIPDSALVGSVSPVVATPTFDITPSVGSATLSGTALGATEPQIREGGRTIILTLTGDEWVADGGTFDAQRQNIIDGLDAAESEAKGWDAVFRPAIQVGDVFRDPNNVDVIITLPEVDGYEITANENITATIPGTAVLSGFATVATPDLVITATTETATIGESLADDATELEIVAGGEKLEITLANTKWLDTGGAFDAIRQDIIDGLDSDGVEATGWNTIVRDALSVTAVARTSDTLVTITLPAFGSFDITTSETITVTVPESAILGPDPLVAGTFDVTTILPQVDSIAPDNGPLAGGTSVVITGSNFTGTTDVDFGATPAASFVVDSDLQITAVSPAGTGPVDILVMTGQGQSANSAADDFTYADPPEEPTIEPPSPGAEGYDPGFQTANPGGELFKNNSAMVIIIRNDNPTPTTVTFTDVGTSDLEAANAFNPDVTVTIPAGEERIIGPFPSGRFSDDSDSRLSYTVSQSLLVAVINVPENS